MTDYTETVYRARFAGRWISMLDRDEAMAFHNVGALVELASDHPESTHHLWREWEPLEDRA